MARLVILPMERRYLPQVLAIEQHSFSDPWNENAFEVELDHPWAWFRVAGLPGPDGTLERVDGFILCYMLPGDMHVINVAVVPGVRKSGLGKRLLKEALDTFAERGGGMVGLEVRISNQAAQTLYRSFGFSVVGTRPGYYRKENEDALVMVCRIEPAPGVASSLGSAT